MNSAVDAVRSARLDIPENFPPIGELISVIIPTRDAGPGFRDLLASIRGQRRVGEVEILVLDSDSSDETLDLAREFDARVIPIDPRDFSHGGTRNIGGQAARGSYLVFTVQDALPLNSFWLFKLVSPLAADPGLVAVSTRQLPPHGSIPLYAGWALEDLQTSFYAGLGPGDRSIQAVRPLEDKDIPVGKRRLLSFFDNVASCIRRDYFLAHPFSPLVNAEDMDYGFRLLKSGAKFGFIQSAGVIHYHDRGPGHVLKVNYLFIHAIHDILHSEPHFYFTLRPITPSDLRHFFLHYLARLSHILRLLQDSQNWLDAYTAEFLDSGEVPEHVAFAELDGSAELSGSVAHDLQDLRALVEDVLGEAQEVPNPENQTRLWQSSRFAHFGIKSWVNAARHAPPEQIGRALLCLGARFFGQHLGGYVISHAASDPDFCRRLNQKLEHGVCRAMDKAQDVGSGTAPSGPNDPAPNDPGPNDPGPNDPGQDELARAEADYAVLLESALARTGEAIQLESLMDEALLAGLNMHPAVTRMRGFWEEQLGNPQGLTLGPQEIEAMATVFQRLDSLCARLIALLNPKDKKFGGLEPKKRP